MGWRVSLYKADKEVPVKIEYTEDSKYPNIEINGEQIVYDCATDVWCYLKQNSEEFNKEIVNLYDNPDCDYYTISKAGFKMLVLEFRRRIINYLEKVMYVHEHPDEKDSIEYWEFDDLDKECLMTLDEFKGLCDKEYYCITDYDGHGYYAKGDKVYELYASPRMIRNGFVRNEFTYVCWYKVIFPY